jgi:serine/threonine-protein kinase
MGSGVTVGELVDGKYRIVRLIGEGGWGLVFEAENIRTLKRVAIKMLRTHAGVTADIQARFQREAQAAGRIGSEHIVEVFDLGVLDDGTHYMVMELLTGQDVATRLRERGRMDPAAAARVLIQVLDGLGAAHDAGILHRDLKPENLFLVPTRTGEEFVKILDFGISKFNADPAGIASATMTGAVLGSPCYMAPEQARGLKQVDKRTDLYAVGTLMFECLTGRVPFEGDNFNDLMFRIVLAPRPNPCSLDPSLDPDLGLLVTKAISVEPQDRFQSAAEMRAAIVDWLSSRGLPSVHPPEFKHVVRTTPRLGSGELRVSLPEASSPPLTTPMSREPHWSEATLRAESGMGTPLAASSATPLIGGSTRAGARRTPSGIIWGVALAAVVLAAGAVAVGRSHVLRGGDTAAASKPIDPVSAAQASAPDRAPPSAVPAAVPPVAITAPVEPPPAPVPELAASVSGRPGAAGPRAPSGAIAAPRAAAAAKPVVPPPSAAPVAQSKPSDAPPASAPPAPAATPKGVGTVEGREIRTGL